MHLPFSGQPPVIIALIAISLVSTFCALSQYFTKLLEARRAKKERQAAATELALRNYELSLKGRIAELEEMNQTLRDEARKLTGRNVFMANELRSSGNALTQVFRPSCPSRSFTESDESK